MRYLSSLAVGALVLHISMSYPAVAQEDDSWIEYVNREDRFSINLPAQPTVEEFTYISEYESPWEARRYTAEHEGFIYRMTVVDMSTTSLTPEQDQYRNVGRHGNELRGAMAFAAMQLRQTGTVTLDAYEELQVIPGHKLEITLPDGSANIVANPYAFGAALHSRVHLPARCGAGVRCTGFGSNSGRRRRRSALCRLVLSRPGRAGAVGSAHLCRWRRGW